MGVGETRNFGEIIEFSPINGLYPQILASYPQKNIGGVVKGCPDMGGWQNVGWKILGFVNRWLRDHIVFAKNLFDRVG